MRNGSLRSPALRTNIRIGCSSWYQVGAPCTAVFALARRGRRLAGKRRQAREEVGLRLRPQRSGAALFLSSIFGRQNDPDVLALYQWLSEEGIKNRGRWFDEASTHNVLRAMVVDPVFAGDKATALAVEHLADLQTDTGTWDHDLPFYQILNALAHLDLHQAEIQLEKAFERLFKIQNSDGTWSQSEPEWNTFLAIHALKNKGFL